MIKNSGRLLISYGVRLQIILKFKHQKDISSTKYTTKRNAKIKIISWTLNIPTYLQYSKQKIFDYLKIINCFWHMKFYKNYQNNRRKFGKNVCNCLILKFLIVFVLLLSFVFLYCLVCLVACSCQFICLLWYSPFLVALCYFRSLQPKQNSLYPEDKHPCKYINLKRKTSVKRCLF